MTGTWLQKPVFPAVGVAAAGGAAGVCDWGRGAGAEAAGDEQKAADQEQGHDF